jgi:hypothetical protein
MRALVLTCALAAGCGFQSVGGGSDLGDLGADGGPEIVPIYGDADGGPALYGVWGAAADDVFAVGDRGSILHYDGQIWDTAVSNTSLPLSAVWGTARDRVYASGGDDTSGIVLGFDGLSWNVAATAPKTLLSVWAAGDDAWAGGAGGTLLHKPAGGVWAMQAPLPVNPVLPPTRDWPILRAIAGTSPTAALAAGDADAAYFWDGAAWNDLFRPNDGHFFCGAAAAPGAPSMIAVGSNYAVWRFTPPSTLDLLYEEQALSNRLHAAFAIDATHAVMVGENGRVMTLDGSTVRVAADGVDDELWGVWGASIDEVWLVGYSGRVWRARHLF